MSERRNGCLLNLLRWFNFILILLTGICYAAPHFPPNTFWPFIFLGMGFPIVIFMNIGMLLLWLIKKRWYFVFPLICLIMSWGGINKFFGNPFRTDLKKESTIKILSYNARGGGINKKGEGKKFKAEILKANPDIICFQELNIDQKAFHSIREKYPYTAKRYAHSIISKYPIIAEKDLKLEKIRTSNGALYADININGKIIRVYNVHLHSNSISGDVEEMAENPALQDLKDKETWKKTRGILGSVRRAANIRSKQAAKVKKNMKTSPYPNVLCGDFNDPPQSYTYKTLSEGLKDTFVEKGRWFGFSYKGSIPFLKIDYMFVSPEIKVASSGFIDSNISDHKLLLSTLVLPLK